MVRLTRRRVLVALAAIGGGSILGGHAVTTVRGAPGSRVSIRWPRHPHVHAGSHGPVLEFDALEPGQLRQVVVRVVDGGRPTPYTVVGVLSPTTVPLERVLFGVWTGPADDETARSTHGSEPRPITERFDRSADGRPFEIVAAMDELEPSGQHSDSSRTHRLRLAWGISPASDGGDVPDRARLAVRFESEGGASSRVSEGSALGTDSTNRLRTSTGNPDDVVRFPFGLFTDNVTRDR